MNAAADVVDFLSEGTRRSISLRLAAATRDPQRSGVPDLARYLTFGVSPRASIHLVEAARALGFLRGRDYVLLEDLTDLVHDVFRHRLVLSYEALADGLTADAAIGRILAHVRAPEKPLEPSRSHAATES